MTSGDFRHPPIFKYLRRDGAKAAAKPTKSWDSRDTTAAVLATQLDCPHLGKLCLTNQV